VGAHVVPAGTAPMQARVMLARLCCGLTKLKRSGGCKATSCCKSTGSHGHSSLTLIPASGQRPRRSQPHTCPTQHT
jgi:hypothetical protein